jgi:hypothetical protein
MTHYFLKLIPPRPTFAQDLTPDEAALMQAHAGYWHGMMERGLAAAFGLVGDPAGAYGVGIIEIEDGADVHALAAQDPTILANAGFKYEIHQMPRAVTRARR